MPKATRRETLNKSLAVSFGWTKTDNRNWRSPWGEVFAMPPDYCRSRVDLSYAMMLLDRAEREKVAEFLASMKEAKND